MNNSLVCPLPAENPHIINIQNTYGYNLIGAFFSSAVWGVSCLQLFLFFVNSELDSAFLKTLLVSLWILDTANEILILMSNWPVLILQYGRIAGLKETQPELMSHAWIEYLMGMVVQIYFIHRIYKLSITMLPVGIKFNMILGTIILLLILSIAQPVLAIAYVVDGYGKPLSIIGSKREIHIALMIRGLSVFVDVCIAIAMVYLIYGKGHFSRSRRMISRLMIVVVSTGSLTAILSVIMLVLVAVYPNGLHFTMIDYASSSIYFSTLLANLNSRSFVRGTMDVTTGSLNNRDSDNTIILRKMDNSDNQSGQFATPEYVKVQKSHMSSHHNPRAL
ncbi:hypothetical protein H2248_011817 [Termitomyces sp. 'cryptogamus']|nr:hypothetical protein H2248_011817 [Termitomyces sp. 'cryptogamus']